MRPSPPSASMDIARKTLDERTDALDDGYADLELFSLSSIKGTEDLVTVDKDDDDIDDGGIKYSDSEDDLDEAEEDRASDVDSEEERRGYNEHVKKLLDEAYENFVSEEVGTSKPRKKSKHSHSKDDVEDVEVVIHPDQDSYTDVTTHREANPLIVPLEEDAPTLERRETEKSSEDGSNKKTNKPLSTQSSKGGDDIEIVPFPATDSSDSSDVDDMDSEILARAKKMLTKKQIEEILDDDNKYKFYHFGLVPNWFMWDEEEEKKC